MILFVAIIASTKAGVCLRSMQGMHDLGAAIVLIILAAELVFEYLRRLVINFPFKFVNQ